MEGGITLHSYFRRIFIFYNSLCSLILILHSEDFGIYIKLVKCES